MSIIRFFTILIIRYYRIEISLTLCSFCVFFVGGPPNLLAILQIWKDNRVVLGTQRHFGEKDYTIEF